MLEPLIIERSKNNPEVVFNKAENILKISGRSIVEDPNKFYMPIYEWLEAYVADPNPETEFKFDLEYFNSSSARQVMKLIMVLEKLHTEGKKVKVLWLFEQGDEMAQERGMEIKAVSKLPFDIVEYESDDLDE
jgi:hypothetical protein